MDNGRWILYWRLSATSTLARKNLYALGLPPVNLGDYKTYSELVPQSQGGQTRQGYINARLLWDELDFLQFKTLTGIVEAAITAGVIYATVPKDNGTGLLDAFIDIHGIAIPLEYQPVSNARGVVYQNVVLAINAVVVDADPSTVV
jgi:hypothetical protein